MLEELFARYPRLAPLKEELLAAVALLERTYRAGGKVLLCGNGGSCADCDHIVGELMKGFLLLRPMGREDKARFDRVCDFSGRLQQGIPAISLPAQSAVLTAFLNDVDPELVYAQLTYGYGREGDLLIALSTSGNSGNVVNAVLAAKAMGMATLALTGQKESRLSRLCQCTLRVPETETYKVQELQLPVYHYLCAQLEQRLFGSTEERSPQ